MPDYLGTTVFVSFDGDHIGRMVGRASLADDIEGLRRISQSIDKGNQLWGSWALASMGTVISLGGDEGRVEVPADHLGDLQGLRSEYHTAVGATCSVGVGMTLSEADKALLYAKVHGGNRQCFYSEDMGEELKEIAEKQEKRGEISKIADEYLGKGDVLQFPKNRVSPAGQPGPQAPVTPLAPRQEARQEQRGQAVASRFNDMMGIMASDPGMQAAARQRDVAAKEQQLRMGGPAFKVGDRVRCSHAHDSGGCSYPWPGKVTGYEPNISRDNGIHHYTVAWETQPGSTSEGLHAQTEIHPVSPMGKAEAPGLPQPQHATQSASGSQGQQARAVVDQGAATQMDAASAPAPAGETSGEQRLHAHAQKQKQQDTATAAVAQQQSGKEALKQQVVKVLQATKQVAPMLEEIKSQAPQVYKAVLSSIKAMCDMAKQLFPPAPGEQQQQQPDDKASSEASQSQGEDGLGKSEPLAKSETGLEKMACIHDSLTKPMTVYRMQNADGQGPYAGAFEQLHDMGMTTPSGKHPDPRKDFSDDFGASRMVQGQKGNYAFEKPEHAEQWFGREGMRKLRMLGYNVTPVQARKVHRSMTGRQVLFEPFHEDTQKAELPMPGAPAHARPLNLPVGSTRDGRIKVRHGDGRSGWVEVRAGIVMSQDGHAVSSLNPGGR